MHEFKTPILWMGEQPQSCIIKEHKNVMDSAINYYNTRSTKIKVPYSYEKLFLDNGAYTALYRGIELDVARILDIQETISPDFAIPLDYPFKPGMDRKEIEERCEKTKANILYWQAHTSLKNIPTLHAFGAENVIDSIQWLQKRCRCDSDFFAVGSVITRYGDSRKFSGFFGGRQPSKQLVDTILFVSQMARQYSDFGVHFFGFGSSPLTYHLAVYCGIYSTDSSGYRRRAAFGQIILPQTATRYICDRKIKFGRKRLDDNDIEKLIVCGCPICKNIPPNSKLRQEKLASDWILRAVHNKWVMEEEEMIAKELLEEGMDVYEGFIEKMFARSSLNYMFKYAKKMKKQSRLI